MPSCRTPFEICADDLDIQVWSLSAPDRYAQANEAHALFLGLTADRIEGRPVAEVVSAPDLAAWTSDNSEAFRLGVGLTREIEVQDAQGRLRTLLVTSSPVAGTQGEVKHLLCHASDVTAERESRHRLGEASRAAQAASIAKRNFLANMSHEIRTPLNGVIGVVEILSTLPSTEEQRRYLSILSTEARNILELVNGILDFSKIEAGRMEIESVPMSLAELARSLVETMSVPASRAGLELKLHLDEGLPRLVMGDPTRLRQVLTNLLGNALKFTRKGHVSLSIVPAGRKVRFTVEDTGVGVPKDRQEAVFGEFEQVDGSTTRNYGGTGLGGTIARNLVRLMGSDIELSSEVGVGTTVSFELNFHGAEGKGANANADADARSVNPGALPATDLPGENLRTATPAREEPRSEKSGGKDLYWEELSARIGETSLAESVLEEFIARLPGLLGRLEASLAKDMRSEAVAVSRDLARGADEICAKPLSMAAAELESAAAGEADRDLMALFSAVQDRYEGLKTASIEVFRQGRGEK